MFMVNRFNVSVFLSWIVLNFIAILKYSTNSQVPAFFSQQFWFIFFRCFTVLIVFSSRVSENFTQHNIIVLPLSLNISGIKVGRPLPLIFFILKHRLHS